MERLALILTRHRPLALAFVVVVSVVAALGARRLTIDDEARGIFRSDDEHWERLERLYEDFGSDDNECIVAVEVEDAFRPATAEALRELGRALRGTAGVESAFGLADLVAFDAGLLPVAVLPAAGASEAAVSAARERARGHPLVYGQLLAPGGDVTLVLTRLAGGSLGVAAMRPVVAELQRVLERWNAGGHGTAHLTGIPPIRVEIYGLVETETPILMAVGALVSIVIATLLFRTPWAVLPVIAAPAVGALWTMGALGLAGLPLDILSMILPTLVMVIGLTDSIHIMVDMRRARSDGADGLEAAFHALRDLALPCLLTSITTAVGFLSLSLGSVDIIQRFGLVAAAGVVLTFVAVVVIVPLGASFLPRLGAPGGGTAESDARWSRRFGVVLEPVLARPRAFSIGGLVVTLALLAASTRLRPDNALTEATPASRPSVQALRLCDEAFGGVLPTYAVVEWEAPLELTSPEVIATLESTRAAMAASGWLAEPLSPLDLAALVPGGREDPVAGLRLLPEAVLGRLAVPASRHALVVANSPELGSSELAPRIDALEAELRALAESRPGIGVHLSGTTVVARRNVDRMIADLALGLAFASFVIFVILALELRSVRMAAIALIPNAFPLAVVGGTMALLGVPLQIGTAIVFTVLLGIAVDDTIHLLARFRLERARGDGTLPALRRSYVRVGRALLVTTLVLGGGFSVDFISELPTANVFAVLMLGGLCAALVGDLVLLPALLAWTEGDRGAAPELPSR